MHLAAGGAKSRGRAGAADVTPWPSIPAGHMLRRRSAYLSRPRRRTRTPLKEISQTVCRPINVSAAHQHPQRSAPATCVGPGGEPGPVVLVLKHLP